MKLTGHIAVLALFASALGAGSWQPLKAQDAVPCRSPRAVCDDYDRFRLNPSNSPTYSPQMLRDSGRPVVPVFEGWFENEDGTYTLSFGYISMNLAEPLNIPLGPDNFIEPSEFDGGQPTHFRQVHPFIRRPWSNFTITVPADFGDQRIVWTLRNNGDTYSTPAHITSPPYLLDDQVAPARYQAAAAGATQGDVIGSYAPEIRFDVSGPRATGIQGVRTGPLSARVGQPLELSVLVDSRGRPESWLWWTYYSGPGDATFSVEEIDVPLTDGEGVGTTTVTFSEPGDYVLLVQAIENLHNSFEYHCCWTNGHIEVTVTN